MNYRKKPVVIQATQWFKDGDHPAVIRKTAPNRYADEGVPWVPTLEGGHIVTPGDWIITGVKGEHYPCKPEIFEMTYESAALDTAQTVPEVNEWKDAVTDALVVAHILTPENAIYPRKAVQDVIDWNCQVALDPRVSSKAQALVDSGKSVQVNAGYGELEAVMSAEFESHGFGAPESNKREYGRFRVGFASGRHSALTAAKQAQPARPINCGTGHCSCIECPYEQAQPERAPLSEAQVTVLLDSYYASDFGPDELIRKVEQLHGIKQGGQHD